MKKKDLKIGEVYADKWGSAYLLVSTHMWGWDHYGRYWWVNLKKTVPSKGFGYTMRGTGVLCLTGSAEGLRRWALEHPELLAYDDKLEGMRDTQEFIKRLRDSLPAGSNFRIIDEDYRQWPGTYEETRNKLDEEQQLKDIERDKLRAKAYEYEERAEIISKALTDRGVELTWSKRKMSRLQGEHGQSIMHHSGYELSLDDLEKLLDIKTEET